MVNFQDLLNEQSKKLNSGGFGQEEQEIRPEQDLKHDMLDFKNGGVMVRVLPSADPSDPRFFSGFQEFWANVKNSNGKELVNRFVMGEQLDPEDEIEQEIAHVLTDDSIKVMSKFGEVKRPTKRYLLNVVQILQDNNGNLVHEVDQKGNLVVRVLQLPQTAFGKIINQLQEPLNKPQGSGDLSFIDSVNAFPIKISQVKTSNNRTEYDVNLFTNQPLGALPQGWENQLENLDYQALPSSKRNPDYSKYVLSIIQGKEQEYFDNQGSGNTGGGNSGNVGNNQQQPTQQFNQQPVQQQQPAQQFNQQPNNVPTAPNPTQQQVDNLMPSGMGNDNNQNQNQNGTQGQQPNQQDTQVNQQSTQQPNQPVQQEQQSQPQPQQQQNTGGGNVSQDVDDLLSSMKNELN